MTAIKKNQTLLDFVTQFGGAVDELFNVCVANGLRPTEVVAPGTLLVIVPVVSKVTNVFKPGVDIITFNEGARPVRRGIGYMQIGTSFIVS